MYEFQSVTLVVLASTEQQSLKTTIQTLLDLCDIKDLAEILVYFISADCPSVAAYNEFIDGRTFPIPIRCAVQQMPGLSPAIFEIPRLVNSSHFLIIASDLEMDPQSVPQMIAIAKKNPAAIVCASKFVKGAQREKYGLVHYICNRLVNRTVKHILHIEGTELISTFQVYPLALFYEMDFTNPKRTFYEYTIRPLTKGTPYIEVPTSYKKRTEGESNFYPMKYINLGVTFIRTALDERKRLRGKTNTVRNETE